MADLAKIQQETNAAYQPAYTSLQNQLGALDSKLASTTADIDKQYNRQIGNINRAANDAAYAASIAAAGNGGSFGGSGEIAREKYYNQSFVPAMQQAVYGKNDAYKSAREARDTSYENLANQLAQLQAEANKYALQRYDAAVEAERQEALQRAAIAAQNNALSYMGAGGSGNNLKYSASGSGNNWSFNNANTGANVRFGTYINQFGGDFNNQAQRYLREMANGGDTNAQLALSISNMLGKRLSYAGGGGAKAYSGSTDWERALNTLGLKLV